MSFYTSRNHVEARLHMLKRKHMASCLLLSVVSLGFLVSQANAASIQNGHYYYEGYVRMTRPFYGIIQHADVEFEVPPPGSSIGHLLLHTPSGYTIECETIVIYGGDGSVSASCINVDWYAKFWTKGLLLGSGLILGVPATLNFYLSPFRGQFAGALVGFAP